MKTLLIILWSCLAFLQDGPESFFGYSTEQVEDAILNVPGWSRLPANESEQLVFNNPQEEVELGFTFAAGKLTRRRFTYPSDSFGGHSWKDPALMGYIPNGNGRWISSNKKYLLRRHYEGEKVTVYLSVVPVKK
jgi:hypothetical protein